jgi:hypothetical protein
VYIINDMLLGTPVATAVDVSGGNGGKGGNADGTGIGGTGGNGGRLVIVNPFAGALSDSGLGSSGSAGSAGFGTTGGSGGAGATTQWAL